jgi:multiple sugar transport system substrate-binding protein
MPLEPELRGVTWNHERGVGGVRAATDAFLAEHPRWRVDWSTRSLQAFADQPLEELARRFDLLVIDHPAVGHAVARGCLRPLDGDAPRPPTSGESGAVGRSDESYEWEGHRWAFAIDAAAQVAAYRPDLLESAGVAIPRTWNDALEAAAVLRRRGLWAAMPMVPVDAINAFLAACVALGGQPFEPAAGGVARTDVGRAALDLLASMISRCHPSSLLWNPPRTLEHMATEEDVAYCPLGFGYSNYARPGFRDRLVRFAGAPAGGDGVPMGTLGGAGLAVSAHSAVPEEAVALASFIAQGATQRGVYFRGGGQPAHRAAWTDPTVNSASSCFFSDTLDAVDAAYLRPRYDGFVGFQDAAGSIVHSFLRQPVDAEATLARLDEAYATSLAGARG